MILTTENDYCKLCDASFNSPAVTQAHYQGKNYAKSLRLPEPQSHSFSDSAETGQGQTRKEGSELKMLGTRRNMYTVQNNSAGPYFNARSGRGFREIFRCALLQVAVFIAPCVTLELVKGWSSGTILRKQHKSKVSKKRSRIKMKNLGCVQ